LEKIHPGQVVLLAFEDLPQRLRIGDEAVEAKTDQRRAHKPSQSRRSHRRGG